MWIRKIIYEFHLAVNNNIVFQTHTISEWGKWWQRNSKKYIDQMIRVPTGGTKTTRLCMFTNIEYIGFVSIRGFGHVLSLAMPSKYMQHCRSQDSLVNVFIRF